MTYQGHLNDGSGVQKHSAGGLYPFVIFDQQSGERLDYGVLCPNGSEFFHLDGSYQGAVSIAEEFKRKH